SFKPIQTKLAIFASSSTYKTFIDFQFGHWEWGIGNGALGIGNWALGIGHRAEKHWAEKHWAEKHW
ncbi:hypothetical protein WMG39_31875, partial [Microcoleus anatoxicus PTRS2]